MRLSRRSQRVAGKDLQNVPALTGVSVCVQSEKHDAHRYIKDDIDLFRERRHDQGLARTWSAQDFPKGL